MTKQEAVRRIKKLVTLINRYRYEYHVLDRQEISDEALDSLKKELFDLENNYPDQIRPDSPTQRVGGKALDKFVKYAHKTPMLSFDDAFSIQDMTDWLDRAKRLLSEDEIARIDFLRTETRWIGDRAGLRRGYIERWRDARRRTYRRECDQ